MTTDDFETMLNAGPWVSLPAGGSVALDRPVALTRSNTTVQGNGFAVQPADGSDGLVLAAPSTFADPARWSADAASGRTAFRTGGDSALVYRYTPADLGPQATATGWLNPRGYQAVRQFALDLWVRRNEPAWRGNYHLAGCPGPHDTQASPWRLNASDADCFVFFWTQADGKLLQSTFPFPADNPAECRISIRVNFDTGALTWTVNGVSASQYVSGRGFGNDYSSRGFWLGAARDSGAGVQPGGPDWTFLGCRVSWGAPPVPATPADWFSPLPDTLFLYSGEPAAGGGRFAPWRAGAAGRCYPGYTTNQGHGHAVRATAGERIMGVTIRDLAVAGGGATTTGCSVLVYPASDPTFEGVRLEHAGCGLAAPAWDTSGYTFRLRNVSASWHGAAGVELAKAIAEVNSLTVRYCGRHALRHRGGGLVLRDFVYAPGGGPDEPTTDCLWLDGLNSARVDSALLDYEGCTPRSSYVRVTPSAEFASLVRLTAVAGGDALAGPAIRLDGGGTPGARLRLADCFNAYAGAVLPAAGVWSASTE